ncbi:MAG TPA: aminoacetone oxidase family FAD-binding enzyme [Thermoanaerobaculia bacterium]|nr:aminoacetone oxidase family FAD-binding enzyme [Thermoanaerobaculia bacterium]
MDRTRQSSDPPVVVVGAGAAGTMAAIFAAKAGRRVLLLESTPDGGRKILVSGGGRCNVLPSDLDPTRYVTDSSPNTLKKILLSWPLAEQRRFFEQEVGLPLAREAETGKLFPVSNQARDVRDRLYALARRQGVEFRFQAKVVDLTPPKASGQEQGTPWTVHLANQDSLAASAVVLATGGLSLPGTGSEGTGLHFARRLGHEIHPTYPALTPLTANPHPHRNLAGLSPIVTLRAPGPNRNAEAQGGFLFTHRGYSGPTALDLSHLAVRSRLAGGPRQPIYVQWNEMDAGAWEMGLREAQGTVLGYLRRQLPDRLAEALFVEAGIPADRRPPQLRREERLRLLELLTRYPLLWTGDEGYAKAEVTGGGVALSEVNPRTLESRRCPGLFLCGEMLDAFGPIGGYNFVWAWVTGRGVGAGTGRRGQRAERDMTSVVEV